MPGTLHFSIDIDGDRELSRKIHGMVIAVTDWEPAFKRIAADWSATMKKRFAAQGAIEGDSAWASLSDRYAAWKRRKYPGRPILQRTGKLRRAAETPQTTIDAMSLRLRIGTPYAIYHQSRRPRTSNLPRRGFASLSPKQKGRWVRAVRDHIHEAAKG